MMTDSKTETPARKPWRCVAAEFARELGSDRFPRGDLAELRRMNPDKLDAAAFWRLTSRRGLLGQPRLERKWALILQGVALMTPTASTGRSAHDKSTPVGRALFIGGDPDRTAGFYSETRLNRLLTARGSMLASLLTRMFRMMASAGQPFDWVEMADLILSDGHNEKAADRVRRRIASAYYQAENKAIRSSSASPLSDTTLEGTRP